MNHHDLLPIAREAVAIGSGIITTRAVGSVTTKSERDLVTDIDLAVEDAVRTFLLAEAPHVGVLGEEHGHTGPTDLWWALDPVDGTTNFARGIPLCAVSLGLVADRTAVLGAITLPFLGVDYHASSGHGAYANDTRIRSSTVADLPNAVISIGDFAVGTDATTKNAVRIALLTRLGATAQRIRMIGTAAIDLAWVAEGKLDATVILANMPWDTLAGTVLVREAGGLVVDLDDTTHNADSTATIAVGAGLRHQVLEALRQSFDDAQA
ncbi:inositol monophosphatase family protein [Umezawaea endophytica]|uniref:Inositol monophosphatase n=1 Tax=Umezawaea endophytica TaxID=1654476 RepID=A0A9X2VIX0_9PSEU|nr:inositol monophosphatase [Umezawaea endophytica]MCS7475928.1 inositol monophosphatase [Umezawaea endophytica]